MFDKLSYKARRRLALLVLCVGMPLYIVVAVNVVNALGQPHFLIAPFIYIVLGFIWVWPFKGLFKGIGKPDPDAPPITWDDEA